jgi:hypothetical protein
MPGDGTGRFGYAYASPYTFYYVDLAWLPWLEINTRLTTFDNVHVTEVNAINVEGQGRRYMDKAIDLKAMLYRSPKWYVPSVAFGVTDVMGTELMKAWYGVATWHFDRWALSAGYGTDRLNGVFGGVSWNAAEWLTLKAEYSPLDYSQDHAGAHKPHPDAAEAKYNLGAVVKAPWGMEGAVSWQRGEEFVVSLSQRFDLQGDSFLGLGTRGRYDAPGTARVAQWRDVDPEKLGGDILDALSRYVRVRDVELGISQGKIFVAYENYGHSSQAEAMVRVLVVLASLSPHLDSVFLIPRLRGVPVVRAEFPGTVLFEIRARDMKAKDPLQEARFTWADKADKNFSEENSGEKSEKWLFYRSDLQNRAKHDLRAMVVYEPRIDQTLDDDYQNRWSVDFIYENRSSRFSRLKGWGAFADVRVPFYNDVDIWWEPDMTDDIRLQQAVIGYLANLANLADNKTGFWAMGEVGWLDENWFGLNLWGRTYTKDGRWWGGARLSLVRDRDPQSFAGLAEGQIFIGGGGYTDLDDSPWRSAAWLQGGYNFPEIGLDLQVDYGRFADTDAGAKLSATRRWDAAAVGFWISRTDNLTPGKDFTNVGVRLELPAERWFGSWLGKPSAHIWEQDVSLLSTWRLDAGREPGSRWSPERILSQLRPIELKKNVEKLLWEYCAFESSEPAGPAEKIGQQSLVDFFVK